MSKVTSITYGALAAIAAMFVLVGALATGAGAITSIESVPAQTPHFVDASCYVDETTVAHACTVVPLDDGGGNLPSDTFECGWVWVPDQGRSVLQTGSNGGNGSTCYYEQDGKLVTYTLTIPDVRRT